MRCTDQTYGNFDYCNSDQAYKQGKEVALAVLQKTV